MVIHHEVNAEEFAEPLVLRDRRETLIQQVLEAVVVSVDEEVPHLPP